MSSTTTQIALPARARTRAPRHVAPALLAPMPFATAEVGAVPFAVTTLRDSAAWFLDEVALGRSWAVRLANAYCVALSSLDDDYASVLRGPGVNLPDGSPVAAALRRVRSQDAAERVRGADFMRRVIERSGTAGPRHFLLGATTEVLAGLEAELYRINPHVRIAGSYAPPFEPLSPDYVHGLADVVRGVSADIVWVGLGTPKQDHVAVALQELLDVSAVGVGAAFDFLAGTRGEAPRWVQRSGFEWLYRMLSEPRRLGRRYLVGNVLFLRLVLADVLTRPRRS